MSRAGSRRDAVIVLGATAFAVLGCAVPPSHGPQSEIVTGADGLRTFTWVSEVDGNPVACPAFGLEDPVRGTLEGTARAREPISIRSEDGRALSVIWPAGFQVKFEPLAALYSDLDAVVARDGQDVVLGQTRWDEAAGTYEDPYIAHGLVFGGCYSYFSGVPPASPGATPAAVTTPVATVAPSIEAPGSPTALSPAEIRARIEPFMGEQGISIGEGAGGVIVVGLRANAEELARKLHATYGDAVQLSVGLFPFPPPDAPERTCLHLPQTVPLHVPLAGALAVDGPAIVGAFYRGSVRLTNVGPAPYELSTSSNFNAYLFRPGETSPIAMSEGGSMGTGYGKRLAPGESVQLDAGGGTASCDLALGYALPPGVYEARALVDFSDPQTFEVRYFWTDPATLEIVGP